MSRSSTGAPVERVRSRKRNGETGRAFGIALTVIVGMVAIPAALVLGIGNPIPAMPDATTPWYSMAVLGHFLACLVWIYWAQMVECLRVEFVSGVRSVGLPRRVRIAFYFQQELARDLVMPVLLRIAPSHGLRSARVPARTNTERVSRPRHAAPPANPATDQPAAPTATRLPAATAHRTTSPERVGAAQVPALVRDFARADLLAAGLGNALAALRRQRIQRRHAGDPVPQLAAEAADFDVAIRLNADASAARFVDRALRWLARGLEQNQQPTPTISAARLSGDRLELLLAAAAHNPPAPFRASSNGMCWYLPRDTRFPDVAQQPAPLPGLVSLGVDQVGRILIDLEATAGPISIEGDINVARSVVAAAALELATNFWSEGAQITLVGFGNALAPLSSRLRCVATLAEVQDHIADRLSQSRAALTASGVDSALTGRLVGVAAEPCAPEFVIFAAPPDPQQLQALLQQARMLRRAPFGVLIAGATPAATWRCSVDQQGTLSVRPLGLTVASQQFSPKSYAALAQLLQAEAALTRAPWEVTGHRELSVLGDGVDVHSGGSGPASPTISVSSVQPIDLGSRPGVLLRIFGEPDAAGEHVHSGQFVDRSGLAVEIATYLALNGPSTVDDLTAAIWPYGISSDARDAVLRSVVDWLGVDATGQSRLRIVDNKISVSCDVVVDWQLFVTLGRRSVGHDLVRALSLVRGPLTTPHSSGRYAWLAKLPASQELPAYVADIAHRWAMACLARKEYDAATWALRAGLQVAPISDQLWEDLAAVARGRDGAPAAAGVLAERDEAQRTSGGYFAQHESARMAQVSA